jgi:NAD(P)-dependent dehydrogenase (short-subunit alcohol dehydrogenase family)
VIYFRVCEICSIRLYLQVICLLLILDKHSYWLLSAYNASKAGLVQLAKCLAVEWVDFARVNCVSPGYIETELLDTQPQEWRDKWFAMIPSERMAQTYEMKGTYVYLASDASSYTTGAEIIAGGAVSRAQFVLSTFSRVG